MFAFPLVINAVTDARPSGGGIFRITIQVVGDTSRRREFHLTREALHQLWNSVGRALQQDEGMVLPFTDDEP